MAYNTFPHLVITWS